MDSPASNSQIVVVPIGDVDRELLDYLSFALSGTFGDCTQQSLQIDVRDAYNSARRQYHSTQVLRKLRDASRREDQKLLGVMTLDLFIPIFTFVFGEAQVGGSVALMSTQRLGQEFYGLPGNRDLLFARTEKEATHELGHAFGLGHCRSFECVMHFSNSVEEVDLKASDFCRLCDAKLHAQSNSMMAA